MAKIIWTDEAERWLKGRKKGTDLFKGDGLIFG